MQHKYRTEAIVLARHPLREHDASVVLATMDFGVVRAKATGLRKPGSKMAMGLQTFTQSEVTLIRAKDGWRLTGALPIRNWAGELSFGTRTRAARVCELMQRLSHGEEPEQRLYQTILAFARSIESLDEDAQDAAECLAALRILQILGHDAGELTGDFDDYTKETLGTILGERKVYVTRINNGIAASGL